MKQKQKMYRQGDVLLVDCKKPSNLTPGPSATDGRLILAHGEVTGHHHSIDATNADWWKTEDGATVVRVNRSTALTHQEHGPIPLTPRYRRVVRQRQYTPEAIRRVED